LRGVLRKSAGDFATYGEVVIRQSADVMTRRALTLQDGPTVLSGHSWGGTVVSEMGTNPKITALVYLATRTPDAGEDS
jgi:pimeloyl-ACP methyl ester carboxylesterase